ncbi:MAG: glycogen debranching enzyme family protein [Ferruginibacter sp.]|nr:glycogen debranching enzyme family protein [Cytophagales bacterium]
MNLTFDQSVTQNFERAVEREWIETNGLGGWASSSLIGLNTRRYHGLLVAATKPPVGRVVLLSKLDETLYTRQGKFDLGCNQYVGSVYPQGYVHLTRFEKTLFPEFTYEAGGVTLKKTVVAVAGENTTLILYEVVKAEDAFTLELLPLVASRDYHSLVHANPNLNGYVHFEEGVFHQKPYPLSPDLFIGVPGSAFEHRGHWYHNFQYRAEMQRGMDFREDLFCPGNFRLTLREGDRLGIIVSTQPPFGRDAWELAHHERTRREQLLQNVPLPNNLIRTLTLAADQFVVKRDERLNSIIAGYHWFSDWGRDTMISLPGLCLVTGRFEEARRILLAFARHTSQGMLPNRFSDWGEEPQYNNVDATLWFFVAVHQYQEYTQDHDFVRNEIMPVLKDILDWYGRGTRYNIHVEEDGLLYAGIPGEQLTWMDAKVDNWVVTPRQGKPVEVNALWYNALTIYARLLRFSGDEVRSLYYTARADKVLEAFNDTFWNEDKQCLYDYIGDNFRNDAIRPNQLFALSLPFALVSGERAKKILKVCEDKLLTPVGLRSLSADHVEYQAHYEGNLWSRDGAYHQGTVWSWLLGPYVDAVLRVKGAAGRKEVGNLLQNFGFHFREAGIGTVSEIFDAEAPHPPRGCIAQSWSVAELLRVILQHRLYEQPVGDHAASTERRSFSERRVDVEIPVDQVKS